MSSPPQAVASLTERIKTLLESNFCQIIVKGELSNVSLQPSGHLYFGIKDSQAFLNGAFFHFKSKYYDRKPKDGDAVIIHGKLAVYAPRGQYQIVAHALVYAGEGDLLQKFEETKRRLTAEGYFATEKKKPLPFAPQCIGVITSPTGAVIQDILRVLSRRARNYKILVYPVTVQGNSAAHEISKAIEVMNAENLADVLIIARGGGSIEDLWAFNEEILVKAIHASTIPIVSAVGHETDYTLCDFASDVRAPTPSAAAEIVCKSSEEQVQVFEGYLRHLLSHSRQLLTSKKQQLLPWRRFLDRAEFYTTAQQQLDSIEIAIQKGVQGKIHESKQRYDNISRWLQGDLVSRMTCRLQSLKKMLSQALSHKALSLQVRCHQLKKSLTYPRQIQQASQKLSPWRQQLDTLISRRLHYQKEEYFHKHTRLKHAHNVLEQQLRSHVQKLELLGRRLSRGCELNLQNQKIAYANVKETLATILERRYENSVARYSALKEQLHSLNPKNVLKRGYAMLFDFNENSAMISVDSLQENARVRIQLQDGEAILTVTNIEICKLIKG
ncbi:exodeoxyribonuclease VII large chain [Chlamydia pneumoniae TW-183]|uniref:Exodeoxyribonuclease 7 large subunit n=2 Tax=Chlamydia pneumoniae TaxID=83558 RepID=EX7L_CHLPN|nr:exodeoxyribonuclease VII large subunit [Chlamydia pneumoniae]Q9Z6J7.1 RecName: Full=Exodeoxyribonuclease 7 large subunit; AltName: Full=Exodeoxyribonuclease VII large subunit; Short=Exonuclease VII large subunit [Chlamydia pneumoniae]AAD19199.1 Exodoxyribonuclease VII [Chlamydia pneumoniae CWL029]AAF38586.1 exodeoxyribonuclease, large subunit [Chlamydia pneumoniae AR39]AAP99033.1 exodeoxyribonuclease VII large chain [Chlamydia pneumoniae TW-183]ACZ32962.1 exodeoxyribonuclease VII, large sub